MSVIAVETECFLDVRAQHRLLEGAQTAGAQFGSTYSLQRYENHFLTYTVHGSTLSLFEFRVGGDAIADGQTIDLKEAIVPHVCFSEFGTSSTTHRRSRAEAFGGGAASNGPSSGSYPSDSKDGSFDPNPFTHLAVFVATVSGTVHSIVFDMLHAAQGGTILAHFDIHSRKLLKPGLSLLKAVAVQKVCR